MFVELVYGLITNSLSLITDSAHMFFDCSALVLSLLASYFASFPENKQFTYGYGRIEVVSGLTNCVFLVFVAFSIIMESIDRIINPETIHCDKLLVVAVLGLIVNMIGLACFHTHHHHSEEEDSCELHEHHHSHTEIELQKVETPKNDSITEQNSLVSSPANSELKNQYVKIEMPTEKHEHAHNHSHENENLSGVFLHIMADALGSVGVIISALLIKYFNFIMADAICSLVISGLILLSIIPLMISTLQVLVLYTPEEIIKIVENCVKEILLLENVMDCTEFSLWRFRQKEFVTYAKIILSDNTDKKLIYKKVKKILKNKGISKKYTIEIDFIKNPPQSLPNINNS